MCSIFICDYLQVPIRNDEILYEYINQKRLARILPEITGIFMKLFIGMSDVHYSIARFMCMVEGGLLDKDEDELQIIKWKSMARWYSLVDTDFGLIEILLQEHCVCKTEYISEVIGYYLDRLFCVKDVHRDHSKAGKRRVRRAEAEAEAVAVAEAESEAEAEAEAIVDEAIRIVEGYDELYD